MTVDNNKVTDFIVASGTLAKRATDELGVKVAAEKSAQARIPAVIDLLVTAGLTDAGTKEAHAQALTSHETTLQVLGNLVTRFNKMAQATKTASTIGEAVTDGAATAQDVNPYVGVPQGHQRTKASAALFAALDVPYGG